MPSDGLNDALALDRRTGLPDEMLYLRNAFPRERWTEVLPETAAFWLQMHAGFRAQQAQMTAATDRWRSGAVEPRGLHAALIPTLQAFLGHLDGHHRVESGHYFPQFRQIEPRIQPGLDLLDRDHDAIHGHLDALYHAAVAFHQAVAGQSPDAPDHANRLADTLDRAAPGLTRHLDDEEDIVIPLMALKGEPAA